jgi:sulfur-oxidizing protein SoxY
MTAINYGRITRRNFLRAIAAIAAGGAALANVFYIRMASAQAIASGLPLPDEPVAATLKRLFGERKFLPGDGKIKLDLPLIAEDGGNVAVSIDCSLPVSGEPRANRIYIIADKNRRPMLAKFAFTPDSGRAFISTSVRLATTTDVRAVVEMSDGTLYAMQRNVRVTISGCDLPPQS